MKTNVIITGHFHWRCADCGESCCRLCDIRPPYNCPGWPEEYLAREAAQGHLNTRHPEKPLTDKSL